MRSVNAGRVWLLLLVLLAGCHTSSLGRRNTALVLELVTRLAQLEDEFYSRYGKYAELAELPDHSVEIEQVRQSGCVFGHRVTIAAQQDGFEISAEPLRWGETGFRSLFVDETMMVRESFDPGLKARDGRITMSIGGK